MSERRLPLTRRVPDPTTSPDPRVQSLLAGLALLDYAPEPRPEFRAELRAQLVAITPRIVAEEAGAADPAAVPARTAAAPAPSSAKVSATSLAVRRAGRQRRTVHWGRPVGVAASVVAVLALLLGGATWLSQKSLPGGALYGLKRTSEDVRLSLTSGDAARGHAYLAQATTRVQEARDLAHSPSALGVPAPDGHRFVYSAAGLSTQTSSLIASTLRSADGDVEQGATLLGEQAVQSKSAAPLDTMTGWAPGQLTSLSDLAASLPAGPLRTRVQHSWTLTNDALSRAKELKPRVSAPCASTARHDDLGPVPTSGCTSPAVPNLPSTAPGSTSPVSTPAAPQPRHQARSTAGSGGGGSTSSGAAGRHDGSGATKPADSGRGPSSAPSTKLPTLPTLPRDPSLPVHLPTKPVSADSCGVGVSAGPLGINLGTCSNH